MGTTPKALNAPNPRSVVYVIRSDKSGAPLLKIGTTTDLHRRLRELARRTLGELGERGGARLRRGVRGTACPRTPR